MILLRFCYFCPKTKTRKPAKHSYSPCLNSWTVWITSESMWGMFSIICVWRCLCVVANTDFKFSVFTYKDQLKLFWGLYGKSYCYFELCLSHHWPDTECMSFTLLRWTGRANQMFRSHSQRGVKVALEKKKYLFTAIGISHLFLPMENKSRWYIRLWTVKRSSYLLLLLHVIAEKPFSISSIDLLSCLNLIKITFTGLT